VSRSWSRALGFSLAGVLALGAVARGARAADDPMVQCIAASDKGLDLRKQGKLLEARRVLATCAPATCGADISGACQKRLTEINARLPTIVFLPKDSAGHDLAGVKMYADGATTGEILDGRPAAFNPGLHAFKFEVAGQPSIEQSFVLVEGTKDRQERVAMGGAVAAAPAPGTPAPSPAMEATTGNGQRLAGVVVAATGVVAMGIGGVLGLSAKSSYDGAPGCEGTVCQTQQGLDARNSARSTGNFATGILIAGAVVAVGGGVLWLTAPRASRTEGGTAYDWRLGVAPAALVLGGRF